MRHRRMLTRGLVLSTLLIGVGQQGAAQDSLQVDPATNLPDGGANYTPANSEISNSMGSFSPSVTLELPGAARDFVPRIDLTYSQGRVNGALGVGWGLAFESRIERRSEKGGTPEVGASPDAFFYLDGQRLWELGDGTYRTEQDDYTVYEAIEQGGRIIRWTASKNGRQRTWGQKDGSSGISDAIIYADEVPDPGGSHLVSGIVSTGWLLSRDEDPSGNRIDYDYTIENYADGLDGRSMRHLPSSIRYNYHPSAAISDYFTVNFTYEDRDDIRTKVDGITRYESHRLAGITVENSAGQRTHDYGLEYTYATHDQQSRLTRVYRTSVLNSDERTLRVFDYQDDDFSFASTSTSLTFSTDILPDPSLETASMRWETTPLLSDVNGDSRPDLIVLKQKCGVPSTGGSGGGQLGNAFECQSISHAVFINKVVDASSPDDFEYDSDRSAALVDFFGALYEDGTGDALQYAMVDINRDGYLDLLRGEQETGQHADVDISSVLYGSEDGWDINSSMQTNWLAEADVLKNHQLVDLNGDGYPDLVGQSAYELNIPDATSAEHFSRNALAIESLSDPVVDGGVSSAYNDQANNSNSSATLTCMDANSGQMAILSNLGVYDLPTGSGTAYTPDPNTMSGDDKVTPDEWVWRHTQHADVNGDGHVDRVIDFPFLEEESAGEFRDQDACGYFSQIYLGDGRGGFEAAGYGLGDPIYQTDWSVDRPVGGNDTTYSGRHHDLAFVDANANGRAEVTTFCNDSGSNPQLKLLSHEGLAATDIGFGFDASGDCPTGGYTTPLSHIGFNPMHRSYQTLVDINSDGLLDAFSFAWSEPDDAWQIHYYPQSRDEQNRLVEVTTELGATTDILWSRSALEPENHIPMNIPVVTEVTNQGKTTYRYTDGSYLKGDFLGFGTVEIAGPTGISTVERYHRYPYLRGKMYAREVYDADSRLHTYTVNLFGPIISSAMGADLTAPYVNPLLRTCHFEMGLSYMPVNLDALTEECDDFIDENGASDGWEHYDLGRTVWQVLRGEKPSKLTSSPAELTTLEDLARALQGESNTMFTGSFSSAYTTGFSPVHQPPAAGFQFADTLEAVVPSHADTYASASGLSGISIANRLGQLPHATSADYRLYVTEWDYDIGHGNVIQERQLRDVDILEDSLIIDNGYQSYDPGFYGARLHTQFTADRVGEHSTQFAYTNYTDDQWGTRTQTATGGSALPTRSTHQSFDGRGLLTTQTDARGAVTHYTQDHCGQIERVEDPVGNWTQTTRGSRCLAYQSQNNSGLNVTWQHNGFREITSNTRDTGSSSVPIQNTDYLKNYGATFLTPHMATAYDEGNGQKSVKKSYVDSHGRTWLELTCVWDGASANLTSSDIDSAYPCVAGTETRNFKLYYNTGELYAESVPFNDDDISNSTVGVITYTYDEFGRVKEIHRPDGTKITRGYALGWDSSISPSGVLTINRQSTIETRTAVDAISRGKQIQNAFGKVVSTEDAAGNITTYDYDAYLRKTTETLESVEVIDTSVSIPFDVSDVSIGVMERHFTYFIDDRLKRTTDLNGYETSYTYDLNGRQRLMKDHNNTVISERIYIDGATPELWVKDEAGNISKQRVDADGNVLNHRSAEGLITAYGYDSRGRLKTTTHPWGAVESVSYDALGQVVAESLMEDSLLATKAYERNGRGLVTLETDADGAETRHSYDVMGRLLSSTQGDPAGTSYALLSQQYNADGQVEERTEAGAVHRFAYDTLGRLIKKESGCSESAPGVWDCLLSHDYTYTALDAVETDTDKAGVVTTMGYDALGRQTSLEVKDADGVSQGIAYTWYDQKGQVRLSMDEEGVLDQASYDERGRLIETQSGGLGVATLSYLVNPSGLRDGVGGPALPPGSIMVRSTSPTGEVSDSYSNRDGLVFLVQGPDLVVQRTLYADGLKKATQTWEAEDNGSGVMVLSHYNTKRFDHYTDSNKVQRDWDWMSPGNAQVCKNNPACGFGFVAFSYTAAGRLNTVTDAAGNDTTYHYSSDNTMMLDSVTRDGLPEVSFTWDSYGKLDTRIADASGTSPISESVSYEDELRIQSVSRAQVGGGATVEALIYDYNDRGLVEDLQFTATGQPDIQILKDYDAKGRLIAKSHLVDAIDYGTLEFGYYDNGLPETVTYPSGNEISYVYQAGARLLTSVVNTFAGSNETVLDLSGHDAAGRPLSLQWLPSTSIDSVLMTRTYVDGREKTRDVQRNGSALRSEVFTYDAMGRLNQVNATLNLSTVLDSTYSYNERSYLTHESHDDGTTIQSVSYGFDNGGRRDSKVIDNGSGTTTITYDYTLGGNKLAGVTTNGTAAALTWNDFAQVEMDQAGRTFAYGLAGQLQAITDGSAVEHMGYGPDGVRIWRDNGTVLEYFLTGERPDAVYSTFDDTNGTFEDQVRLPSGTVIATLDGSGNVNPIVRNITGSPYWSKSKGDFTERNAFGELLDGETELNTDLGFHQMLRTESDRINIAGVRAYDGATGRFLSADPLGFASAPDINDSADLFRYAHNNPIAVMDPTGYAGEMGPGGRQVGHGNMPVFNGCKEKSTGGCITGGDIKSAMKKSLEMKEFSSRYTVYRAVHAFGRDRTTFTHLSVADYEAKVEQLLAEAAEGGISQEEAEEILSGILDVKGEVVSKENWTKTVARSMAKRDALGVFAFEEDIDTQTEKVAGVTAGGDVPAELKLRLQIADHGDGMQYASNALSCNGDRGLLREAAVAAAYATQHAQDPTLVVNGIEFNAVAARFGVNTRGAVDNLEMDIVDFGTNEFWEVKPASDYIDGLEQILRRRALAIAHGVPIVMGGAHTPSVEGLVTDPWEPGSYLFYENYNGVILYTVVRDLERYTTKKNSIYRQLVRDGIDVTKLYLAYQLGRASAAAGEAAAAIESGAAAIPLIFVIPPSYYELQGVEEPPPDWL